MSQQPIDRRDVQDYISNDITKDPVGSDLFKQQAQSVIDEAIGDAIRAWGEAIKGGLASIEDVPEVLKNNIEHYIDFTTEEPTAPLLGDDPDLTGDIEEQNRLNEKNRILMGIEDGSIDPSVLTPELMQELGIDITEIRYPYYGEKADGTLLTKEEFDEIIKNGGIDANEDGALSAEELADYEDTLDRRDPGPELFPRGEEELPPDDEINLPPPPPDDSEPPPDDSEPPPDDSEPPPDDSELPPEEQEPPPEDQSPPDDVPARIIDSDLANNTAVQDLMDQNQRGELNLSISGILAAIFGANLDEALTSDALINEALALFGLSRDVWNEDPNKQPNDDLPPDDEINNEPPPNGSPPPDDSRPDDDLPPDDEINNEPPPGDPNGRPSGDPNGSPPGDPNGPPSGNPNGPPSGNPNGQPSGNPNGQPSGDPNGRPSGDPNGPPDDNDDNDDGDNGMPDWLEDLLGTVIGGKQPGGAGTGVGVGGEGGSSSIGDLLTNMTSNIIQEAPDYLQQRLATEYYTDALKDASDAELEFLRELMQRQDTFQIFRNLGLPITDANGNIVDDNERVDFEINQLRKLVNQTLEDQYQIQPELELEPLIKDITPVDPDDLGQIDVANLLLGADLGQSPDAIETEINRIDFVNPYLAYGPLYSPDAINTNVNQIDPFNPEDPTLRFLQDEGRRAIESSAAAEGRLNTGGTLQELQNQAIGTAAQYAGDLAEIGRVQDASRMGADQQYYTQLFGSTDRDNALNMARLDSAMAAQNLQDASRLSRDQQVYSQLLGSGEQDYSRGIGQLGAVADAQNLQDETALRGDIARFESDLAGTGQQFDQSRFANVDDLARNEMLYNQFGGLLDVGIAGAKGLTGNTNTFGTLGGDIYSDVGDRIGYEGLKKGDRIGNVLGGLFNR